MNPIAHTVDPATSHQAAAGMDGSGKRWRHKKLVLQLCKHFPASTAIELWESAEMAEQAELKEPQEVRRRLTDLLADGLVRQGPERRCRFRNTNMVTWLIVKPTTTASMF